MMMGWMTGEQRSTGTERLWGNREKMKGKSEGGREVGGNGKQVKMNERKRKRETDAENGSRRIHNMLTVGRKHERWISRREMRRERGREYDAVEMER